MKDPTAKWPWWPNDVYPLTFPSIATFQLSPIPTSIAPGVRNTSVTVFFSNLYLQSWTVGCCLKTLRDTDVLAHHPSMLKSYLSLFFNKWTEFISALWVNVLSCSRLVWRHWCFWSLVIRSQWVLPAFRGAIMKSRHSSQQSPRLLHSGSAETKKKTLSIHLEERS